MEHSSNRDGAQETDRGRAAPAAPMAFTEEYDIDFPIVQAALGIVSMPPLVAAVSNAGGMGTLGAMGTPLMTSGELRKLILAVRSLTSRPFGVSFMTPLASEDHVRVCIEEAVRVVSFDLGIPSPSLIESVRAAGLSVWLKVTSAAMARAAVDAGADAVIAQGREAGGANSSVTGVMTLVPAVVDAIDPVPVLAAGGIADGRGLAAALALGADAVWMGTRFLASHEANAHAEYKRRVLLATDTGTTVTTLFHTTHAREVPVRVLENEMIREWTGREKRARASKRHRIIGRTELGGRIREVHRFSTLTPTPETTGDFEQMCLFAGESAALVHDLRPAATIVRDLMIECTRAITSRFDGFAGLAIPGRKLFESLPARIQR